MRRSFNDLYALARHGLQQDPLSGHLFAFINRRASHIKVLYWDRTGFCIWAKRLESGRFLSDWRQVASPRNGLHRPQADAGRDRAQARQKALQTSFQYAIKP
jgi:transposase